MSVQRVLTTRDRELGRRRYLWFCRLNGFAFTCIGDNVLILYALKLGMPEYLLGLFSSFLYLTMPLMFVGRGAMAQHGATKVMGWAWVCRHLFALLLVAAPWMPWTWLTLAGMLVAWLGFCMCRSIGMVGFSPLIGDITDSTNRGKFSSAIFLWFNVAILTSMGAIVLVTRFNETVPVYQGIVGVGVLTGLMSSWHVMRVPESEAPRESARRPIVRSIVALWGTRRFRRLAFANAAGSLAIVLIAPLSMAALKKGYGVGDDTALFFAMVQILGGLGMALLSGIISDHCGPRPLIVIYGFGMLAVCLLWLFCPETMLVPYALLIFAMMGAASMGTLLSFSHYFLMAVKDEDRVSASILTNVVVGLAAGVLGSLVSAGLMRTLQSYSLDGLSMYRAYFGLVAVGISAIIVLHFRLESLEDWRVSKVLGLMFSPRDLRALLTISRIASISTPAQDSRQVTRLATNSSDLSADALVEYLDSPDFNVRGRAIHAIGDAPLTEPVRDVLLRELTQGEFTTAYIAAQALGDHRVEAAIPALREALQASDLYLCGKAMVALVQLGDRDSFPAIRDQFLHSDNPRILIHGARALADMAERTNLELLIRRAAEPELPAAVRQELLYHAARLVDSGDEVYHFLKAFRKDPQQAIQDVQAPADILNHDGDTSADVRICCWLIQRAADAQ